MEALRFRGGAAAEGDPGDGEAQEAGTSRLAGHHRRPHDREDLLGQGVVREFGTLQRFANRLPRGRTYVRNGSVIDLQIAPGTIQALVSGSEINEVSVKVMPVTKARWRSICNGCAGAINSVVELLQGRLARGVMERICRHNTGLFPSPKEIRLSCSCPDSASMCKHMAAVLYGIGTRFGERPELLFRLHELNEEELIAQGWQSVAPGQGEASSFEGACQCRPGGYLRFGLRPWYGWRYRRPVAGAKPKSQKVRVGKRAPVATAGQGAPENRAKRTGAARRPNRAPVYDHSRTPEQPKGSS
jgi:hypothetical protein